MAILIVTDCANTCKIQCEKTAEYGGSLDTPRVAGRKRGEEIHSSICVMGRFNFYAFAIQP